jgi:hypothetical protein
VQDRHPGNIDGVGIAVSGGPLPRIDDTGGGLRYRQKSKSRPPVGALGDKVIARRLPTIPVDDGEFDDEFEPRKVHLYRLR